MFTLGEEKNSNVLEATFTNKYDEDTYWECTNLETGSTYDVGGTLAKLLEKYPDDFKLSLRMT